MKKLNIFLIALICFVIGSMCFKRCAGANQEITADTPKLPSLKEWVNLDINKLMPSEMGIPIAMTTRQEQGKAIEPEISWFFDARQFQNGLIINAVDKVVYICNGKRYEKKISLKEDGIQYLVDNDQIPMILLSQGGSILHPKEACKAYRLFPQNDGSLKIELLMNEMIPASIMEKLDISDDWRIVKGNEALRMNPKNKSIVKDENGNDIIVDISKSKSDIIKLYSGNFVAYYPTYEPDEPGKIYARDLRLVGRVNNEIVLAGVAVNSVDDKNVFIRYILNEKTKKWRLTTQEMSDDKILDSLPKIFHGATIQEPDADSSAGLQLAADGSFFMPVIVQVRNMSDCLTCRGIVQLPIDGSPKWVAWEVRENYEYAPINRVDKNGKIIFDPEQELNSKANRTFSNMWYQNDKGDICSQYINQDDWDTDLHFAIDNLHHSIIYQCGGQLWVRKIQ